MNLEPLERYRPVVDDWGAFADALAEQLPTCLVANTPRVSRDALVERLGRRDVGVSTVEWTDDVLILDQRRSPGNRFEYLTGLYNVQEEAAVVPVKILDPRPGERVLDMCAAPGNKTAQIAMALQNSGTVVANDRSYQRMRATRSVLDRLGLANVAMTICDGANYPNSVGGFDRVLVDVPCSCEGTSRKSPSVLEKIAYTDHEKLGGLQRALLRRAFELCEPGGRVVYSTCTYAPEENEMVVDDVVAELDFDVEWVPCRLDGFQHAPGLVSWSGQTFDPRMERAMRVWPHHNDTGGFFVAAFDKSPSAPAPPQRPDRDETIEPVDPETWLPPVYERFGWPPLDDWIIFEPNRKDVFITNRDIEPAVGVDSAGLGMSLLRKAMAVPKLTTTSAMLFGPHTTRHVVDLEHVQMDAFFHREPVTLTDTQTQMCDSDGYVLVRCEGFVAGVGRWRRERASVESLYPKAMALADGVSAFEHES